MPQDLAISCPKCGESILLDETLAAPVISRIRLEASASVRKAQQEADAKISDAAMREESLAARQIELAEKEASFQTKVNQTLAIERQRIASAERENVLRELSPEMEAERAKTRDLQQRLEASQRAELQLRQERERIDEREKNVDLEIARKVDEQRKAIHEQARKETEAAAQVKINEAENAISALRDEIGAKGSLAETLAAKLAATQKELAEKDDSVRTLVAQAVADERKTIIATERENLRKELSPAIEAEKERSRDLEAKLDEAQRAELKLRQEKQAVEQREKNVELEVARKVDEQRKAIREEADRVADQAAKWEIAERDKTISDMRLKLEEAQRKAAQGSQQTQGEVLELDLEATLRQEFPQDTIEPVKPGTRGGDILQRVRGRMTRPVATILWEAKRAQSWGREWATKAKCDAAESKAEVALIVSEALPKDITGFGYHEGVWCVAPNHAVMLGVAIRQGVISTAEARQGATARDTKRDRLYDYMIGPEFRATVEGIAQPFKEIYEELAAEKRSTLSRWKRQEKRLERVLNNVAGLQGDLQGIAGSEMPQLPGFELEAGGLALPD